MLALNAASTNENLWKVLIYDRLGQDVISPLLKVNELRESGITVHLPLDKERYPISDVPAIYFVTPSLENLKRIASVQIVIIKPIRIWIKDSMNLTISIFVILSLGIY